jgi:hypothetical protein
MSSACEVFSTICFKIHLDDPTEFALYEVYEKWSLGIVSTILYYLSSLTVFGVGGWLVGVSAERSITPLEYISDILAKAERFIEQNKGKWEDFQLVFKKKLHLDTNFVSEDYVENTLDYYQFMNALTKGMFLFLFYLLFIIIIIIILTTEMLKRSVEDVLY